MLSRIVNARKLASSKLEFRMVMRIGRIKNWLPTTQRSHPGTGQAAPRLNDSVRLSN